jgi:hypothetical protein
LDLRYNFTLDIFVLQQLLPHTLSSFSSLKSHLLRKQLFKILSTPSISVYKSCAYP